MNLDFWPFSYFRRKSEEKESKKEAEIRQKIIGELNQKIEEKVKESTKSIARKEAKPVLDDFAKTVKQDKKGLEDQFNELKEEFQKIRSQNEKVSGEATEVKKNSERIKAYADEAKTKADGAEKGVQTMESAAKRANELCDKIEGLLKSNKDAAVAAAVEKCTATVKSEIDAAVKKAREEYQLNIEDHRSLIEEGNTKKIEEHSKKLEGIAKTGIDSFKKECSTALENLKTECDSALEAFQAKYSAAQDDYQKIMPRLDAAAQKFKKLEEQINRLEDAMHDRPQYLVTAYLLTSVQRKQLRELYGNEFKGDTARYKRHLEEWRDSQLKGKKNLTPAELEIDFVPKAFENMLKFVSQYTRDEIYQLLDVVDLLAGIKSNVQANNSRPGSGRQNKH